MIQKITQKNSINQESIRGVFWAKEYVHTIHKTYTLLMRHFDKVLVQENTLSFSQFIIMNALFSCGETYNQSQLADTLMLTEASISRHISLLKRKKYVITVVEKKNATAKKVAMLTLTKTGKDVLEKNEMLLKKELLTISESIGQKEKEILLQSMNDIMCTMSS